MKHFMKICMCVISIIISLGVSSSALSLSLDFNTLGLSLDKGIYSAVFSDPFAAALPDLVPGDTIDVYGIGPLYGGIYYVAEVTHSFSAGEYRAAFTLERNDTSGNSEVSFFLPTIQFTTLKIVDPGGIYTFLEISSVPEPSTLLLLGAGLIGLAGIRRKFHVTARA